MNLFMVFVGWAVSVSRTINPRLDALNTFSTAARAFTTSHGRHARFAGLNREAQGSSDVPCTRSTTENTHSWAAISRRPHRCLTKSKTTHRLSSLHPIRRYCTHISDIMSTPLPPTSEDPSKYRLPTNVKPIHYDVVIKTDLEALTFEGIVKAKYVVCIQMSMNLASDHILASTSSKRPRKSNLTVPISISAPCM